MPHSHRLLQPWDHWLTEPLGQRLLEMEKNYLPKLLRDCYGKHALLIGVTNQIPLIKINHMSHQLLLTPITSKTTSLRSIEGDFYELPIASSSIDLVLLPHTLELIDNPLRLLSEACRVVKMEGLIIIFGFNPCSLWGLRKKFSNHKIAPWSGHFLSCRLVKKWLGLSDFELVKQDTFFFRPPLEGHQKIYQRLNFLEWLGKKAWPSMGGIYVLMAQAKGIPLTPIKMHWKQQLSGVKASFSGSSIGHWR